MWLRTASQDGGLCLCTETAGMVLVAGMKTAGAHEEFPLLTQTDRQTHTQSSEATAGAAAKRGRKAFLGIHLFLLSGNEAQKWNTSYSGQCWNCQRNGFFTLLPSPQPFATTSAPSHTAVLGSPVSLRDFTCH